MSRPDEPTTPTRCSDIPPFAPPLSTPSCQSRPLPSFALLDNTGLRTPSISISGAPNTLLRQLQNVPSAPTVEKQEFLFGKYDPEKEPIKTYLRIRPPPPNQERAHSAPYINVVNDTDVVMTPPETSNAYKTRNRAPERYHFTRVFSDRATQKEFFDDIALPLVRDVLNGRNSLLFAYGVTNSGKTYTIQGTRADGGLLPRALNVIFNSVKGFQSGLKLRPVGYNDVERYETDDTMPANRGGNNASASINEKEQLVSSFDGALNALISVDHTVLSIDNKYEYAIWVSYAEIYADHMYDLLQSPVRGERRPQLSLKNDRLTANKYIAGLKEVRIMSMEEAYLILDEGQKNRTVFSTILNKKSSRSHGIFTIKIVRTPIDGDCVIEDPACATVSRMAIVDLAGSERSKITNNTGQRLKEAGNINKSLMVLGQCMEILRSNQIREAAGKIFKTTFVGDGHARQHQPVRHRLRRKFSRHEVLGRRQGRDDSATSTREGRSWPGFRATTEDEKGGTVFARDGFRGGIG
ncbi:hypothetical protein BC936DRAFT_146210 [Jimgerdemannia flammicorona]|uniref:Kinesin-like protein n=1 Tax=Jimgerdemannia flammicorona TaxID=994334 RepID=A0A433D835_9FUNG|nr:hypothetical protein BC936DRAFT_146210 [Jimgerdemannia flammicorona]